MPWIAHYNDFIHYKHKYLTADKIKTGKRRKKGKEKEKKRKIYRIEAKTNSNIIQH